MVLRPIVRFHFQERPLDLFAALGYAVAVAVALLLLGTGNFIATILVLFVPGYVVVAALFPGSRPTGKREIDWLERIALSVGLSITVLPLLVLLLNFTPWGIHLATIIATITVFTLGVGSVAYWRRIRLPADYRLSLTIHVERRDWKEYTSLEKGLAVALVASVLVAAGTFIDVVSTLSSGKRFTEFYILGP